MTLTASLALAVCMPGVASAKLSHAQNVAYGRAYVHVVQVFGKNAAGCRLLAPHQTCHNSTDARVLKSTQVLHRMFAPTPTTPTFSSSTPVRVAQGTYTSSVPSEVCGGITPYPGGGRCWAIPYSIVSCESGGSYTAHNPSGASGAYQLMVGGGGSESEQDQNAAKLWNGGKGRSNWVC